MLPGGVSGIAGPLLAAALLAGWALLALDGRPPAALGFHAGPAAVREAALGLALGAGVALAAAGAVWMAGGVGWHGEPGSAAGWLETGAVALWLFALPAAAEEAVFRGYPFQALAESWGAGAALGVTSVGFGVVHLGNPEATWTGAVNVAAAGVFLGLVYLRTGSLWWASAAHLGWNWAHGFLADLPVSGLDLVDAPGVAARTSGPAWLSGGAFGPEGSVLASVVLGAAALWCWRTGRLEPSERVLDAQPLALLRAPGAAAGSEPRASGGEPGGRRASGANGDDSVGGER